MNENIKIVCVAALIAVVAAQAQVTAQDDGHVDLRFLSEETNFEAEASRLEEQLRQTQAELDALYGSHPIRQTAFQRASGSSASSGGEPASGDSGDLAAKSQNPVSDLVSLPFQSNFNFGKDPGDRMQFVGNLQPVIPLKLNEDWNLINRMIVPFVNLPIGPTDRSDGIGDSILQLYVSPRDAEEFVWGFGPSLLLPTASDQTLGFQEWGVGVNGVVLINRKPILLGALVSQVWSVQGGTKPFLVQPFFNYNFPKGWFFSASGEFNADWERREPQRFSFPLGAGIGRVFPIFGQPVSISTRFAPYLEKPPAGPDWQFRLSVTYLFPK